MCYKDKAEGGKEMAKDKIHSRTCIPVSLRKRDR